MALITLISTNELTLVFVMTRTLDLNFVDIVGIRVERQKMPIHKSMEGAPLKSITSSLT